MGIYDRDYYRQRRRSFPVASPRTVVGWLLAVNLAIYLADWLVLDLMGHPGRIAGLLALAASDLKDPLHWWRFLSYAFVHARTPVHVVLNMIGLWMFGREIEGLYGPKEFLRVYLVMAVFGGLVWAVGNYLAYGDAGGRVIGASGAVAGLVVLFALNFPHRMVLLFFFLPVPAWVAGVLMVAIDAYSAWSAAGTTTISGLEMGRVAYTVHLGGAAMGLAYHQFRWQLGRLVPRRGWWGRMKNRVGLRPRLRVHVPDDDRPDQEAPPGADESPLVDEVDRILAKITREGKDSLTRQERRTLENASRQYQRRRQKPADD